MNKKPIIISLAVTTTALVLALFMPSHEEIPPYDPDALFHFGQKRQGILYAGHTGNAYREHRL